MSYSKKIGNWKAPYIYDYYFKTNMRNPNSNDNITSVVFMTSVPDEKMPLKDSHYLYCTPFTYSTRNHIGKIYEH